MKTQSDYEKEVERRLNLLFAFVLGLTIGSLFTMAGFSCSGWTRPTQSLSGVQK